MEHALLGGSTRAAALTVLDAMHLLPQRLGDAMFCSAAPIWVTPSEKKPTPGVRS